MSDGSGGLLLTLNISNNIIVITSFGNIRHNIQLNDQEFYW